MTEKQNQQFKFKAVGSKNGQQTSTTLTVKPRSHRLHEALSIATRQARQWAHQHNLQNFHLV
jgi:hypothetical protein